jgi:ferredoxin
MAMTITTECINCGACEPACPRGAVSQGDTYYVIDAATCTECAEEGSSQCVDQCPVDCIVRAA